MFISTSCLSSMLWIFFFYGKSGGWCFKSPEGALGSNPHVRHGYLCAVPIAWFTVLMSGPLVFTLVVSWGGASRTPTLSRICLLCKIMQMSPWEKELNACFCRWWCHCKVSNVSNNANMPFWPFANWLLISTLWNGLLMQSTLDKSVLFSVPG